MGRTFVVSVRGLGLATAFSWLASCATPPDVAGFAAATGEISQSVRAAGPAIASAIRDMRGRPDDVQRWNEAWKRRREVMDRLVDYGESLVELRRAAMVSGETAKTVAARLGDLANAAGITEPVEGAATVVGIAVDAAAFVWRQIALARGAETMRQSVEAAHPAVVSIAEIVGKDLRDARIIVRGAIENRRGDVIAAPEFNEVAGFRAQVEKARLELFRAPPKDWSAKQVARLAELDTIAAAADKAMKPQSDALSALDDQEKTQLALLDAAADAVDAWAVAHGRLLAALRNQQPVSLESLERAAIELRALIKKVRDA